MAHGCYYWCFKGALKSMLTWDSQTKAKLPSLGWCFLMVLPLGHLMNSMFGKDMGGSLPGPTLLGRSEIQWKIWTLWENLMWIKYQKVLKKFIWVWLVYLGLVRCPTRWFLLFIFGFLFWSYIYHIYISHPR